MLAIGNSKILIYTESIDMRCSFDRLALLVTDILQQDAFSGHYFVFLSKCKKKMKILQWDKDGYAIYYKRLETGIFDVSRWMTKGQGASLEIDRVHFTMMMAGIGFTETKKQKRYAKESIEFGAQKYRVTDSKDYVSELGR